MTGSCGWEDRIETRFGVIDVHRGDEHDGKSAVLGWFKLRQWMPIIVLRV